MEPDQLSHALKVARMYFYQELTTQEIAEALGLSRSKVSRLLSYAKSQGLIEIRILDPNTQSRNLEAILKKRFDLPFVYVVHTSEQASEQEVLDKVSTVAAAYLTSLIDNEHILAVAWGTTISAISKKLTLKNILGVQVVQLNGSGNTHDAGISYSSEILRRFADAYQAKSHPFPVPTFFDYPETKAALWKERSIGRILALQQQADILLYSIGAFNANIPSHVYTGNYLEAKDLSELKAEGVVGDIATVFFREDGSYGDIPINGRASGPGLELFASAKHALCVVAGKSKIVGLRAALRGGYLNKLIIDEPSARRLLALT